MFHSKKPILAKNYQRHTCKFGIHNQIVITKGQIREQQAAIRQDGCNLSQRRLEMIAP